MKQKHLKQKQSYFKNFLVLLIILLLVAGFFSLDKSSDLRYEEKVASQKEQEPGLLASARPAFEEEFTKVVPPVLQTTPYGNDFVVRYRQDLGHNHEFDGYQMSKVFRVRDISLDEIILQMQAHLENNGYVVNRSGRYYKNYIVVDSSPRDFEPDIELIPFEKEGFVDVKVELYRNH